MPTDGERINKFLALNLGLARREADELIAEGRVYIDDKPATLGQRVDESSVITVNGKVLGSTPNLVYLMLNKPTDYVCSRRRQGNTPTIYELLPEQYHSLKPVGRLDKNSSGLIILTNDGDFSHQMTHPKFHKTKVYEVMLDTPLQPLHQQMISDHGIMLEDGRSQFLIERIDEPLGSKEASETSTYRITMSEGRNRQIRRTFAALDYTVTKLHRTQFGTYGLGTLKTGEYREISLASRK